MATIQMRIVIGVFRKNSTRGCHPNCIRATADAVEAAGGSCTVGRGLRDYIRKYEYIHEL